MHIAIFSALTEYLRGDGAVILPEVELTLFGLGILTYVVGFYLIRGTNFPGFTFLASIVALFSGAQLFTLGIIGEYLARMHFRMMERPTYAIHITTFRP